jgi:hypothetical protein
VLLLPLRLQLDHRIQHPYLALWTLARLQVQVELIALWETCNLRHRPMDIEGDHQAATG